MNLEESIKDVIQTKLLDGTIEKIISEKLEKGINDAMDDLFRSYGDVGKVIKAKVTEVLVPAIDNHDFSDYIVKLDSILTEIVNTTCLVENKQLLENFKKLMIEEDRKVIKSSELFEEYCKYVAENVSTSNLEVNTDDGEPTYEQVHCTMEIEMEDGRSWSNFEKANIIFECEEDEDMNFMIPISRWQKCDVDKWDIDYKSETSINSIRYMNDFEVFFTKLKRSFCQLVIDNRDDEDWVTPKAEPKVSFY